MSSVERPAREATEAPPNSPVALSAQRAEDEQAAPQGPVRFGAVLGARYRVAERVGSGGMATIYRGYDETLERPVAVKVLHSHLAGDPELQARFRTEARHAAALAHPHIVAVFDQGVAELPYIVMELVDGPSLREILATHGPMSPQEALAVVEPVARGLARAHGAGVIHRDIKPENVLIAEDGVPKVADFGIARVVAGTSHTQTGALIGSVHYMAPELVDGHEASAASDQYAVGVLLYELLTGERPFAGDSPMAVALRHARDRVPAPSDSRPGCGPEVDAVVARATDHDPAARFPDLLAFAEALRRAVPNGPAEVEVPGTDDGHTLVIPAERQPTSPAALQAEMAARTAPAPATSAATPASPADEEEEAPAARPRGRGRRVVLIGALTIVLLLAAAGGAYAWWHYLVAPITPAPELVGLADASAVERTAELGLGLTVADERYDFDAPEGEVLAQEPAPGTELRRGDDLSVVLSRGREPVDMPSVVGDPEADAVAALEADRLEVEVGSAHHDDVPEGQVISQEPDPDTALRQGDEVAITVSLGIEQVTVPALAGRDEAGIEQALSDAGLELGEVNRTWSDEVPDEGEVISQSREPDATVDKGSTVDVTVSLGPLTIPMPDVRGDAVEDARPAIEAHSLEVEVIVEPRPQFGPFVHGNVGLVEEQLPAAGTGVERGDTVTLYTFGD